MRNHFTFFPVQHTEQERMTDQDQVQNIAVGFDSKLPKAYRTRVKQALIFCCFCDWLDYECFLDNGKNTA